MLKKKHLNQLSPTWNILLNIIFIFATLACAIPLLLAVSISLSDETTLMMNGYRLIPQKLSWEAYQYVRDNAGIILNAYGVTLFSTIVGTVLSVLVISFYAYPLSRQDFKYKRVFTLLIFVTMIFNGGMVPWYIVCTKLLNLQNKIWALIIPYVFNAWYVIILRTFFTLNIPHSLIEAAKIDGAGEFFIFFRIVVPLGIPGIATIALFQTLGYWNDWWLSLMFTSTNAKLSNLQFLLYKILTNIQAIADNPAASANFTQRLPAESVRMALCIIAIGPIILAYPFFQKYFVQGLTVGAIKG